MNFFRTEWKIYVCQYVMTAMKEGNPEGIQSYLDIVLFHADSPEEVYRKAISAIDANTDRYKDENGEIMNLTCHGIHNIEILQDTWEQVRSSTHGSYGYSVCTSILPQIVGVENLLEERENFSIFK